MCILLASLSPASGFGGALVGPAGSAVPTSSATQLVVAVGETNNTVIVTTQVATSLTDLAVLLPAPGIVPGSAITLLPGQFDRLEAFTQPRVERLTCDELVDIYNWPSPPGCASFDPQRDLELVGEEAVDAVPALPTPADVDLEIEVIAPEDLPEWLEIRGFALDPAYEAALQPHLDAGESLLTLRPARPLALGEWLPPVRFLMAPGDWVLPLSIGASAGVQRHELHVYTVAGTEPGTPALANYPEGFVQSECVLPPGKDASEWLTDERLAAEGAVEVPPFVVEYSGLADRCSPCTTELLLPTELSLFGATTDPAETRVSRLWFAWDPGELYEDPVLTFAGPASDRELRFLEHELGLSAIYQPCGATEPDPDAPICENIHLPQSGCDSSARLAPMLAVLGAAALLLRRKRALAWGLALVVLGSTAARAAPADPSPRTELAGGLSLIGTDRIIPTGLDRGAPWLGNPLLALEVRRSLFAWRDGRTVGVAGALRGMVGKAAPWGDQGVVSFLFLEPTVSLEARHGKLCGASPCWFGRYGFDLSVSIVDPSVSPPQARLSGGLHGGFGAWLGRGTQRTSLELRAGVLPRTDGFETTYDPNLGLPGYMFLPGTANLWLLAGRAFY